MSFKAGGSNTDSSSQSSSTSNGTSITSLAPQLGDTLYGNIGRVQTMAATPFQPYAGQMVAGFNPTQVQAHNALTSIGTNQVGGGTLQSAIGTAQGVAGYAPQMVSTQPLTGVDLSGYMNPFTDQVINSSLGDLERQRQIQAQNASAKATAAGVFGGSRSAVLQSLDDDNFARTAASTAANLRQANYTQAQAAAQTDLARNLAASQSNQAAGLQGAGLNLNAANALAGMGGQQLNQALQWAGALSTAGDAQQKNQQEQLNAAYQQWQLAQQYPIQMQQLLNQSIQLVPNYGTTTTNQAQSGSSKGNQSQEYAQLGFSASKPPFGLSAS